MPHGLRTLGKGFLKECLERGERMLLDRGDMLKQGKHSVGPFLTKYNVCALKLCLSNGYVTPRATPFAQTHPSYGLQRTRTRPLQPRLQVLGLAEAADIGRDAAIASRVPVRLELLKELDGGMTARIPMLEEKRFVGIQD